MAAAMGIAAKAMAKKNCTGADCHSIKQRKAPGKAQVKKSNTAAKPNVMYIAKKIPMSLYRLQEKSV